tara:strand:- start:834 stop:1676 length:843 start_codon:yes stop_codon:yes gene_type:complete
MSNNKIIHYYPNKLPEEGDYVVVRVKDITDIGCYVSLIEYGEIEGFVPMKELSKRGRVRSLKRLIHKNKDEVLEVLSVDPENQYIDLSKKSVVHDDIQAILEKYHNSKTVNSIVSYLSDVLEVSVLELYQKIVWKLEEKNPVGGAHQIFLNISKDNSLIKELELDSKYEEELLKLIQHRMAKKEVTIQSILELRYDGAEGIDAIKDMLRAGLNVEGCQVPINIKIISSPQYSVSLVTNQKSMGKEWLRQSLKQIKTCYDSYQNSYINKSYTIVQSEVEIS